MGEIVKRRKGGSIRRETCTSDIPTQIPYGLAWYRTDHSPVRLNDVVFRGRKNTFNYALNDYHLLHTTYKV
jgi:hypothetical protein